MQHPPLITEPLLRRIRSCLLQWYATHHRTLPWRETRDPYRILVSEFMLQQTRVDTVLPYYARFLEKFPDMASLARADIDSVLKAWEGLGYYARARNLHKTARRVVQALNGRIPDDEPGIRSLPGVGPYIAAAVLSIAYNLPFAVVDGNVKRVLARVFTLKAPVNAGASMPVFQAVADELLDRSASGAFNQAVMELGALVCAPAGPACEACPISADCRAFLAGQVAGYPTREKKPPTPLRKRVASVVCKNGRVLLAKRPSKGLLGGLWEFPGGEIEDGESPGKAAERTVKQKVSLTVRNEAVAPVIRHAYTHFRIVLTPVICRYVDGDIRLNGPEEARWVFVDELSSFALPKANLKFLPSIKTLLQEIPDKA